MVNVSISDGKLKGSEVVSNSGFKYYEFLGIPYAKPPVGDLRFKNPQPLEPWADERDVTTSDGNTSLQSNLLAGEVTGSEDCLYLHVYTPNIADKSQAQLLPVMFNIHGGGFVSGSGFKDQCGPEYLVENNVVVVSINYRLGVLGFLNLGIPKASGNMGLKDQVKALKWVQRNIDKFGGDKNNVTIFGISAGAASVDYLLLSPKAKGLFHKAIQQSGTSLNNWSINLEYDRVNKMLLENLKYKGDFSDKHAVYEFLLKIPAEQLTVAGFKTTQSYDHEPVFFGFVPTVEQDFEDAFLTKKPYELLKSGDFTKVPVIKGFCSKEGLMIPKFKPLPAEYLTSQKDFVKFLSGNLTSLDLKKYNQRFVDAYTKEGIDDSDIAINFFGDLQFSSGVWVSANLVSNHNVPVYVYIFYYEGNINFIKSFGINVEGVAHGDDTAYVFFNNLVTAQPDETDILVRSRVTKMWTNFAKTGDPTVNDIPLKWDNFTPDNKAFLNIDKELTISYNYEYDKMALFEEIYQIGAL